MVMLIKKRSHLLADDALKYALQSTASVLISVFISQLYFMSQVNLTLYFVCSAIFVFFCFGQTLGAQMMLLLLSTVVTTLLCVAAMLLSGNVGLSALLIFLSAGVVFFYSTLNMGTTVMSKLMFVPVSFCIVDPHVMGVVKASETGAAVILGGVSAALANFAVYFFSIKQPERLLHKRWQSELMRLLDNLSKKLACYPVEEFDRLGQALKKEMIEVDGRYAMNVDRVTNALCKFINTIENSPALLISMEDDLLAVFSLLHSALEKGDLVKIKLAQQSWAGVMEKNSQCSSSRQCSFNSSLRLAQCFFLLEILIKELGPHLQYRFLSRGLHNINIAILNFYQNLKSNFHAWRQHSVVLCQGSLNTQAKVAIRSSIAMLVSFLVARASHSPHAAWILLSTGIVIQLRLGDTVKKGLDRILGHFAGFPLAFFFGIFFQVFHFPVILGLILVFCCTYSLLKNYFVFGICLMSTLIFLTVINSPSALSHEMILRFLTLRLIDVTIGSLIALFASYFVFKNTGFKNTTEKMDVLFSQLADLLKITLAKEPHHEDAYAQLVGIEASLSQSEKQIASRAFEPARYQRHLWRDSKVHQLSVALSEELASFLRCYYFAISHKTCEVINCQFFDKTLESVKVQLISCKDRFKSIETEQFTDFDRLFYQLSRLFEQVEDHIVSIRGQFLDRELSFVSYVYHVGLSIKIKTIVGLIEKIAGQLRVVEPDN